MESPEAAQIEGKISEKEKEAQRLREELACVEADLRVLYRAREILTGQTDSNAAARRASKGRASIPTLVEQLLRDYGELHVDDIIDRLKLRGVDTNKQTVSSAITRWIAKGRKFKRVGKNKFALREAE